MKCPNCENGMIEVFGGYTCPNTNCMTFIQMKQKGEL